MNMEPTPPLKPAMTAKDLFGLILRSVALWLTIWGAWNTIAGLKYFPAAAAAALNHADNGPHALPYFIFGLPALLGGILALRYANAIIRYTYRDTTSSSGGGRRRGL